MSSVTSTNIRVGPGFYLAIKHIAGKKSSMGVTANLFLMMGLMALGDTNDPMSFIKTLPREVQTAITADILSALGDVFKIAGAQMIAKTSIADLYQRLLRGDNGLAV
jgi:hypothetical protein